MDGDKGIFGAEALTRLAPSHLPSYRGNRYEGENERRSLSDFAERDRQLLGTIYSTLLELFLQLRPFYHDPLASLRILRPFLEKPEVSDLSAQMRDFGRATLEHPMGEDCARTIHDLRGGAFQALSLRMELLRAFPEVSTSMQSIFFLMRII